MSRTAEREDVEQEVEEEERSDIHYDQIEKLQEMGQTTHRPRLGSASLSSPSASSACRRHERVLFSICYMRLLLFPLSSVSQVSTWQTSRS
jgi:hypothetical protein